METTQKQKITVEVIVNAPLQKAWNYWNAPEHITQWCFASDDWHAPKAENDLRVEGKLKTTMAARDGSMSFDFEGVYTNIRQHELIEYNIADGREVKITFTENGNLTKVSEVFDAETTHPVELQKQGWQAILENFKKHVEAK